MSIIGNTNMILSVAVKMIYAVLCKLFFWWHSHACIVRKKVAKKTGPV